MDLQRFQNPGHNMSFGIQSDGASKNNKNEKNDNNTNAPSHGSESRNSNDKRVSIHNINDMENKLPNDMNQINTSLNFTSKSSINNDSSNVTNASSNKNSRNDTGNDNIIRPIIKKHVYNDPSTSSPSTTTTTTTTTNNRLKNNNNIHIENNQQQQQQSTNNNHNNRNHMISPRNNNNNNNDGNMMMPVIRRRPDNNNNHPQAIQLVNECNKTSEDYANELSKTEEWCEAVIRDMRQKKDDLEDTKMQLAFLVCSCFETFDPSLYSEIEKLHSNLKSVTKPSEYHSSSD